MIIQFPDMPFLGQHGDVQRPMVVLLGGRNHGTWQTHAAKEIDKRARTVVRTDVRQMEPFEFATLIDAADWIVAWCGQADDVFYLEEWVYYGMAAGRHKKKLMTGIDPGVTHPMRVAIDREFEELDHLIATATERCRS